MLALRHVSSAFREIMVNDFHIPSRCDPISLDAIATVSPSPVLGVYLRFPFDALMCFEGAGCVILRVSVDSANNVYMNISPGIFSFEMTEFCHSIHQQRVLISHTDTG